jgi:hypothetical protein
MLLLTHPDAHFSLALGAFGHFFDVRTHVVMVRFGIFLRGRFKAWWRYVCLLDESNGVVIIGFVGDLENVDVEKKSSATS